MLRLTLAYAEQGAWFIAWFVELPQVVVSGRTAEEAIEHLYDALALMLEHDHELLDNERCKRPGGRAP